MILTAMGWDNSHLHAFTDAYGTEYQSSSEYDDYYGDFEEESEYKVSDLFDGGNTKKADYEYDFGDGWEHTLTLESISLPMEGIKYPNLVKGKGACPPEDCGGIWSYVGLLQALANPSSKEQKNMLEWLGFEEGQTLDPNEFDLKDFQEVFAASFQ